MTRPDEILNGWRSSRRTTLSFGTLHAIGAGICWRRSAELNTTYRVYDYGRRGADGKLRPLH
ncbi:MAG: hypothetical protein ACLSFT_07470 [Ruminococcus callidus]